MLETFPGVPEELTSWEMEEDSGGGGMPELDFIGGSSVVDVDIWTLVIELLVYITVVPDSLGMEGAMVVPKLEVRIETDIDIDNKDELELEGDPGRMEVGSTGIDVGSTGIDDPWPTNAVGVEVKEVPSSEGVPGSEVDAESVDDALTATSLNEVKESSFTEVSRDGRTLIVIKVASQIEARLGIECCAGGEIR